MNETFRQILFVGAGGFIGSVCRFGLGGLVYRIMPVPVLPYGTLAVNVVGCFLIGLFSAIVDMRAGISPELRWLIFAGFLGGFTTFSAFGSETFALLREEAHVRAAANVGLHMVVGLGAVWVGYSLGR